MYKTKAGVWRGSAKYVRGNNKVLLKKKNIDYIVLYLSSHSSFLHKYIFKVRYIEGRTFTYPTST